ncbi:hypothetical protein ACMGD3_24255 [Lysinibacillus sphaericus]|uniref:hypothetical protein n=1 Tax=Lysinibacillus sphaericus TaxID=1421 RepID=UPI003F7A1CEE
MSATNDCLVSYYNRHFQNLNTHNQEAITAFLEAVLNYADEIHLHNEGNDQVLNQLPLLAIISEVQRAFPNVVNDYSKKSLVVNKAIQLLSKYSTEKRDLLREYFLDTGENETAFKRV